MKPDDRDDPLLTKKYSDAGLKFEFDALLEEYKSIRSELQYHLSNQDQIINYAIAFIALLVTVGQYLTGNFISFRPYILLGASIIFSLLALMFLRYDANIAICSGYISYVLKPRIEKVILKAQSEKVPVLMWEEDNVKLRFSKKHVLENLFLTGGRQGILIVPSIAILLFYVFTTDLTIASIWHNLLLGVNILTILIVVNSVIYTIGLYVKGNPRFF